MMEVKSPNESVCVVKLCHDSGGSVYSCAFYKTMCIPCRHIFSARHFLQLPLFLASMVPQRWLKQYQLCVDKSSSKIGEQCDSREVNLSTFTQKTLSTTTLSGSQKFKKMLSLCHKLATIASQCGMPEFRKKYEDVENILQCWEQNTSIVITAASDHLTTKAKCDVRGDGSALHDNDDSFIDTKPACVDDEFKCGHISTLQDNDNVDSQPNPVDIDTQSHQVDVDTEPRYDDIEIQPGYIDTDIHQRDDTSGHGNVDSKSRCDKIVSLVNSNPINVDRVNVFSQYGNVTDFKTDQVDADVGDHKQTDNKVSVYIYY